MITSALENAHQRYAAKRPISKKQHAKARAFLPSGTTRSVLDFDPFPFTVESAAACLLRDIDGHEYLDYLGDYSVGLAGHNPEAVRDAVASVLDNGWSFGTVAAEEAEVARMLCERFESMDLVRFTSSGTEANLVAINLALKSAGRSKVLVFDGGYHGGFLSFSRGRPSLNVPLDAVICDYNDLDSVREAFQQWPEQIGCVLVEPMLGSGGRIQAAPDFLQGLRTLCDENGSVLIFDEVQTSRMSHGGGQSLLGVRPDLTTLGKYIGGGFGFGVVGGAEELMLQIARGGEPSYDHSGTFNNNRFSMAASAAMLSTVLTRSRLDALFQRGEVLRKHADAILREHGFQATGWGSLMGIHPTDVPIIRASDLAGTDKRPVELLFHEMLERGIYIGKSGFVTLSLPQTAETDAHFLTALESSIRVVAQVGM
ncbi:aspartate aminotransferase family protein [Streptomyces sp. NPDC001514]